MTHGQLLFTPISPWLQPSPAQRDLTPHAPPFCLHSSLAVLASSGVCHLLWAREQVCSCSFHLSLLVKGTCHDFCSWCLCPMLPLHAMDSLSPKRLCHLWMGVVRGEGWCLLTPVLTLFCSTEAVFKDSPSQHFMDTVPSPSVL